MKYLYSVPRKIFFLFFILLFCTAESKADNYVFEYDDNCNNAYHQFMSLHFDEGRAWIIKEIKAKPYNLMATFIADYEDYMILLLNCDPKDFEQRKDHLDIRMSLLDKGDRSSPWYRFCKAGLYLHWTMVYLRFEEQFKAANTFRKSYSLLKENQSLYPDFEYNLIFSGIEEAVVGALPSNYKWIASILGIKGSIKKGIEKLTHFVNTHTEQQPLYHETLIYYLYTKFYFLSAQKEVWSILNSEQFPTKDNLMNVYAKVYIGIDYFKADEVIKTLQEASKEKNYDYYPFFDFQMGAALYTSLDTNCLNYFNNYLRKNKSEIHIKDTWQKMANTYYTQGKQERANYCRAQIKKAGSTLLDVDKNAQRFADNNLPFPNSKLLQARLLLDGGYYTRAYSVLNSISQSAIDNPVDKAEYYYRLGKVYEESGENTKAVEYFRNAINVGKDRHEQFAARAALHIGRIYELTGLKSQALKSYNEALDMPYHDFQNSIDQQAKAGINRVEDKM